MVFSWRGILAVLVGLSLAAEARAQEPLLAPDALAALGYFKYWELNIDLHRAREVNGAYVLDDTLYLTTDSGDVHAIHSGAGLPRWSQNVTESVYAIYPPTHFVAPDGRAMVAVTTSPRTQIIDRYSGDVVADMLLDKATSGSAVASGDRLFFGSADGHFYAMLWSANTPNSAVFLWRVMAGGPVTGAPILVNNDDDIIFASLGRSVYNCTTVGKILNWEGRTGGPIIGSVCVDGPGVFVASTDRSLYRYDAISGTREWRARFPELLDDGPVVSGGIVFQYCRGEGVTALDAQSGDPLWQIREARSYVCRGVDEVLLVGENNQLIKVTADQGKVLARVPLPRIAVPVRNVRDDNTIYLASNSGALLCAKPAGTPHLTPQQLADARRTLHQPTGAAAGESAAATPPKREPEPGLLDPADPLRSPADVPREGGDR